LGTIDLRTIDLRITDLSTTTGTLPEFCPESTMGSTHRVIQILEYGAQIWQTDGTERAKPETPLVPQSTGRRTTDGQWSRTTGEKRKRRSSEMEEWAGIRNGTDGNERRG
jgi:hypothetical protein